MYPRALLEQLLGVILGELHRPFLLVPEPLRSRSTSVRPIRGAPGLTARGAERSAHTGFRMPTSESSSTRLGE
jgi:hypothetical protein